MAKAKKPAAKKNSGSANGKPAAKTAAAQSSASSAASKAGAAAKSATENTRTSVSPSEMKKELEAKAKPLPKVAKETSRPVDVNATADPKAKASTEKTDVVKEQPRSSTSSSTPTPPPAQPEQRKSTFLPLVLGGVVAAGLGYFASEYDFFGNRSQDTSVSDGLRASLSDQETRLAALETAEPVAAPEMSIPELDTLSADVASMAEKLTDIDARLTVLEKQPLANTAGSDDASQAAIAAAVAAYEREFDALKETAAKQQEEIKGLIDSAQSVEQASADAARAAEQQNALTKLNSAIASGQPFAEALATLSETGVTDVPAVLGDTAENGVATLNALQTDFPDSARASLAAARSAGTSEGETGIGGFLKRQLGARSVTPREGNDPDAILSRAEAAVREGRLNDALVELDALPAPAQEAMQTWLDNARNRQAADAATQELSQSLTAN